MMLLEIFESAWKNPTVIEQYKVELSNLLGTKIDSVENFKRVGNKIRKLTNIKGLRYPNKPYKDTIYYYKNISADYYIKYPVLSAMRGSVVREYENGEVKQTAFPFAKFFNMGEVTATKTLPQGAFIVTEKLDGTLVIVWIDPDTGELRFNTRGLLDMHSLTKGVNGYYVATTPNKISNPYVIRFLNSVKRLGLSYELESLAREDRTLMFELLYKIPASKQYEVLDTPEDSPDWKPYFLAYRDHTTMKLIYDDNHAFPIPVRLRFSNIEEVVDYVSTKDDKEGVVIYYPDKHYDEKLPWWNYLVKLKNKRYVLIAYIESGTVTWKQIAVLILTGKIDDVIPLLDREKVQFVKEYEERYEKVKETWRKLVEKSISYKEKHGEKLYNILKYNLHAGNLIKYIDKTERMLDKTNLDEASETTIKLLVKDYLIHKNSKEALLNALDRFNKRLEKILSYLSTTLR